MFTSRDTLERANYHHLVMDIAWFGFALAATSRFLQFYAIRLGADPMTLGWITSLPAIVLIFATGWSAWWRTRYPNSVEAVWIPSIVFRFIFLFPAFAPFFPEEWRVVWILIGAVLPAFGQGMASAIFMTMMRDAVDDSKIPALLTQRYRALNIAVTLGALGFGLLLDNVPFPVNYQIMFVLAFVFSMVSQWHIGHVKPVFESKPEEVKFKRPLKQLFREHNFLMVAIVTFASYLVYHLTFAVIPLHLEHDLKATEGFMGIYGGVEVAAGFLITFIINKWIDRIGNRNIIGISMLALAGASLANALAPNMWWTLIGAFLTGISWTATSICALGYFTEKAARSDMQASVVFHQLIFVTVFIGPVLGTGLVSLGLSAVTVLIIGTVTRLLAGGIILALPDRVNAPFKMPRATDTHPLPAVGD